MKYKIVLHIGLGKTATTSLQHNVFMFLHEARKINFLGKVSDITGKLYHYPFNPLYQPTRWKKINEKKMKLLRANIEKILSSEKINVISEENISVSSILHDLKIIHHNLSRLFSPDEVTILISLRSPVKHAYSQYVEGYYWNLCGDPKQNSFEKYVKYLLRHPTKSRYMMHFYENYLKLLHDFYPKVIVLLYEDLRHDKNHYFETLAKAINTNADDIQDMFFQKKLNVKEKKEEGNLSNSITLDHFFIVKYHYYSRFIIMRLIKKIPFLYSLINSCIRYGLNKSKSLGLVTIPQGKIKHSYPSPLLKDKLQHLLGIKDDKFGDKYGLDKQKLIRYGYFHPDSML